MANFTERIQLDHNTPWWVGTDGQRWMVTVNCKKRGSNQLCHSNYLDAFRQSIEYRNDADIWRCSVFVLMPDHVHMIISLMPGDSLSKIVGDWKSCMSTQYKIQWQSNFHDHRIRHDESLFEKAEYIFQNPVRAGLCNEYQDWQYLWVDKYDGNGLTDLLK